MYHGLGERRFNIYVGQPDHGWRYAKFHLYTCESCGRESANRVLPGQGPASEPFYCECGALVGVEQGAKQGC